MIDVFTGLRLPGLGGWLGSAAFVHFRGWLRHPLLHQLVDHSVFRALHTGLVCLFSKVPSRPRRDAAEYPELAPLADHWEEIRDEAVRLCEDGDVHAAEKPNDIAFNTFFTRGWTRFYLRSYDDMRPSARELCPRTVDLVESIPSVNAALFAAGRAR